jgi:hypothetical protein
MPAEIVRLHPRRTRAAPRRDARGIEHDHRRELAALVLEHVRGIRGAKKQRIGVHAELRRMRLDGLERGGGKRGTGSGQGSAFEDAGFYRGRRRAPPAGRHGRRRSTPVLAQPVNTCSRAARVRTSSFPTSTPPAVPARRRHSRSFPVSARCANARPRTAALSSCADRGGLPDCRGRRRRAARGSRSPRAARPRPRRSA